tara:strand:- start:44 stop:664 length:621 start_codon:yes stop_codon:yes gene_type:complete
MATSLTETVAADADDGYTDIVTMMGNSAAFTAAHMIVGHAGDGATKRNLFVRFNAVDLEAGFTIESAKLQFILNASNSDSFATKIRVDLNSSADPAAYSDGDAQVAASLTSDGNSVVWTVGSGSAAATVDSPDVTALVNSLLALGNWDTGQAMIFQITYEGGGSAEEIRFSTNEHGSHNPPKLIVTYTAGVKAGGIPQTLMLHEMF